MINLSNIVNSPGLNAQSFVIIRSQGGLFVKGIWADASSTVQGYGIVQPTKSKDLLQVPEADRVTGAMTFHSSSPIYETHVDAPTGTNTRISDVIVWRKQQFRIVHVFPFEDYGYYKAIGVRILGE